MPSAESRLSVYLDERGKLASGWGEQDAWLSVRALLWRCPVFIREVQLSNSDRLIRSVVLLAYCGRMLG